MTKKTSKHKPEQKQETVVEEVVSQAEVLTARVQELEGKLNETRQQADKLREQLMRKAAEFENFRKQKEREAQMAGSRTLENIIKELLPLVDDVNRIAEHAPEVLGKVEEARPYVDGVELLKKNLLKWLDDKGVSRIEALGKTMDVNFHEAITQVDHPDADPETVIEEYQAGYVLGDKILRHAKVVVAK